MKIKIYPRDNKMGRVISLISDGCERFFNLDEARTLRDALIKALDETIVIDMHPDLSENIFDHEEIDV